MKSEILIGNERSDHIRIWVNSYERTAYDNSDDANWLSSEALVTCRAWRGRSFSVSLVTRDFSELLEGLTKLNDTLKGEAVFSTLEEQLAFKLIGNGLGKIDVKGEAVCSRAPLCSLTFEFEIDQTLLPEMIRQLQAVVTRFPER